MSFRDHLATLRAAALLVIATPIVAAVLALVAFNYLPVTYEARSLLYVGPPLSDPGVQYDELLASRLVAQTYARLATTRSLLSEVAGDLPFSLPAEDLETSVEVTISEEGNLLNIAARAGDPDRAAAISDAVAAELLAQAPPRTSASRDQLQDRLDDVDAIIAGITADISTLRALPSPTQTQVNRLDDLEQRLLSFMSSRDEIVSNLEATAPNALSLVESAAAPERPVAPRRTLLVGAAVVAGLVGALLAAYGWRGIRMRRMALGTEPPFASGS